jgi:hypothetical protein
VWAHFTDIELGAILASCPPRTASEQLIELARERAEGRGDNCSLAIVKLTHFEDAKSKPVAIPAQPRAVPVAVPSDKPEALEKSGIFSKMFGKK